MLCYRDMTFCPFLECSNKECPRRLEYDVRVKAHEAGLAISQFTHKPECFTQEKEKRQ